MAKRGPPAFGDTRGDGPVRLPVLLQHLFAGRTKRTLRPMITELFPGYTAGQNGALEGMFLVNCLPESEEVMATTAC